jgi:hypothetical protein
MGRAVQVRDSLIVEESAMIRVSKDDQIARLRKLCDQKDARIAELERALHQIKNGCVDEDDKINEWYRSAPSEIRKICETALAGRPVP